MDFRRKSVWLAAALAVAGGAGAVWAQGGYDPNPVKGVPAVWSGFTGTKEITAATKLTASYTVVAPAAPTITVTAKTPTAEKFLAYDASTGTDTTGNTGTVKVVSKYDCWDVEFYTDNKGVLRLGGLPAGEPLVKARAATPTQKDTAFYGIQLGILKSDGKGGGRFLTKVDSATVRSATSAAAIPFSQVFFGKSDTYDTTGFSNVLGNKKAYDGSSGSINKDGFAKPATTDGAITFIVNTGLNIDGTTTFLRANAAGKYEDKITFVLTAGYY